MRGEFEEVPERTSSIRPPDTAGAESVLWASAGNRALTQLFASIRSRSDSSAVQRSPMDDFFEPASFGQETQTAESPPAESSAVSELISGDQTPQEIPAETPQDAEPGTVSIEPSPPNETDQPTDDYTVGEERKGIKVVSPGIGKGEIQGRITFVPPIKDPAFLTLPDGRKVQVWPYGDKIVVVSPPDPPVIVTGSVTYDSETYGKGPGQEPPKETKAEKAWLDQPALSFASRGERVVELQNLLNAAGADPPLVADGEFGQGTLKAVKEFQASVGLNPDGIVGPKTWEALGGQGNLPSIRSQRKQVPA